MTIKYRLRDIGCFADGSFGHDHCRKVLALEVRRIAETLTDRGLSDEVPAAYDIVRALGRDMSDDAAEEDAALDFLKARGCREDVKFEFVDGDLMLVATFDHRPRS